MTVTILTIWNNEDLFRSLTEELAKQKNVVFYFIDIDNRDGRFPGAREAFNAYLDRVETDYVLFVHQDIRFLHDRALHDIVVQLEELGEFGVVGVAGCPEGKERKILSNILHGGEKRPAGIPMDSAKQVQTVDECLFAMRTSEAKQMRFSDMKGWHFYGVEQCVRCEFAGLKNYVVPAQLYHLSSGRSLDPGYITALHEMHERYDVGLLNTTVKQWDFSTAKGRCYIKYYYWKQKLKKLLISMGLLKG